MSESASPASAGIRLAIEAEECPQVLLRILGLLARQWIVPLGVEARCGEEGMRIAIDLEADALTPHNAEILRAKIEATVMVRSAAFR